MEISKEDSDHLSSFFKGLKRKEAQERQDGNRKAKEGKEEMPFVVYQWLCQDFFKRGDIFALTYLIWLWNLMCRTNNVAHMHVSHLSSFGDAIAVRLPKTKADQSTSFAL
jgi:hypothetical protein